MNFYTKRTNKRNLLNSKENNTENLKETSNLDYYISSYNFKQLTNKSKDFTAM